MISEVPAEQIQLNEHFKPNDLLNDVRCSEFETPHALGGA